MFERVIQHLRFAMRTLTRDAAFTTIAVGMLALGIGATVSVFAVVDAVLMTPLPFARQDELVMVWERTPQGDARNVVSAPNFVDWRARNQVFTGLGAISQIPMNLSGIGEAEQVDGLRVTAEFFDVLGTPALVGRTIRSGEDVSGGPRTAVLSYGFWQQRFGGETSALGRMLTVNGAPHEIVGVMPQGFAFPGAWKAELYVPFQLDFSALPQGRNLVTVARLEPGVTLDAAQAEMEKIAGTLAHERPALNEGYSASVVPLMEQAVGSTRRVLWVLFGAVACLLLLACANIANLMLMRAAARAQEMAVRLALGAGRGRLVHQLLVESLVVSSLGGALGLGIAATVVPLIPSFFPPSFPLPRASEVAIDGSVVAFAILLSCSVGVLFGIVPALQARRESLSNALRGGGRSIAATHTRIRRMLVVAEVALALVLAVGAGLMGRSLVELYRVDPGFRTEQVLTMRMLMVPTKYREPAQRVSFLRNVLDEVRATPGIASASSIHFLPLSGLGSSSLFYRADRPAPSISDASGGDVSVVNEGYLETMGIPLIQGRDFRTTDRLDSPRVVIVNETLVAQWYPNEPDVVGKHLGVWWSKPKGVDFEIIGIAHDVRTSALDKPVRPAIYIAQTQEPASIATIVVRTATPPTSAAAAVRGAIARVDPDQGVSQVQTLDTLMASVTARPQVQATVLGGFGLLALIVASFGLYGVMSYAVEQRRREMGVRTALGAAPSALLRLVVGEGLILAAAGVIVGTVLAFATSSLMSGLLYQTAPTDPMVFAGVVATLLLVASGASLVPALRATRVDPAIVLRDE